MSRQTATRICFMLLVLSLIWSQVVTQAQEATNKLPVPSEKDLKESQAVLRDIFKDELEKATTPTKKLKLAKKLLEQALETRDDNAGRYALFQAAKTLAVGAGDLDVAMEAAEELSQSFKIDELATKAGILKDLSTALASADANQALCEAAFQLIPDLLGADDYDTAKDVADIALEAATRAQDLTLTKQANSRIKEVVDARGQYTSVKAAIEILKRTATDPKANLIVGKFNCFMKDDWKAGLPMLAAGEDDALKSLADQDLAEPGSATAKVKVGDGWWNLGETLDGIAKMNLQRRAAYWYEQALPDLSGLTKTKIEKRLEMFPSVRLFGSTTPSRESPEADATQTVKLDNLSEVDSKVGFGKLGKAGSYGFGPGKIAINGTKATSALSLHPPAKGVSYVTYNIDKKYRTFHATVAIGDSAGGPSGSALVFQVIGDGKLLWKSRPIKRKGEPEKCLVTIRNVKELKLQVFCSGHNGFAFAVWVDPELSY